MSPEARFRAGRQCLEGSQSRNRLSDVLACPVSLFRCAGRRIRAAQSSRLSEPGPQRTAHWAATTEWDSNCILTIKQVVVALRDAEPPQGVRRAR